MNCVNSLAMSVLIMPRHLSPQYTSCNINLLCDTLAFYMRCLRMFFCFLILLIEYIVKIHGLI